MKKEITNQIQAAEGKMGTTVAEGMMEETTVAEGMMEETTVADVMMGTTDRIKAADGMTETTDRIQEGEDMKGVVTIEIPDTATTIDICSMKGIGSLTLK